MISGGNISAKKKCEVSPYGLAVILTIAQAWEKRISESYKLNYSDRIFAMKC